MRKALLAMILAAAVITTGCSAAWVATLDSILAAAAPAIINILQIVSIANGQPVNAALVAKVNADAASIKSLAGDYASASQAAAPSVCAQLLAGVGVLGQDIRTVESLASVNNPNTQTKIALLIGLVSSTTQAVTAVIPQCQGVVSAKAFRAAPPLSLSAFTSHYNAILTAKTGNAAVDAVTPKLKIHQHSKLVRYASAGLLK